jgi:hypothetical protein
MLVIAGFSELQELKTGRLSARNGVGRKKDFQA